MLITRTSCISNKTRTLDIQITAEQLKEWRKGRPLDIVCPDLSPSEREFIITGITDAEWDEIMKDAQEG